MFSCPVHGSSRLSDPAKLEHPPKFFAYEKRRFDGVRNEVRPWMTSRPELSVVSWVEDEDEIEQHGPSKSPSCVSVGVYLEACRRNIHFGEPPRHYRKVLRMEDQSWWLGALLEKLAKIAVRGETRMRTDDAVTSTIKGA